MGVVGMLTVYKCNFRSEIYKSSTVQQEAVSILVSSHFTLCTLTVDGWEFFFPPSHSRLLCLTQDTAGSERYEAMSRIYYRGARAAIVCYGKPTMFLLILWRAFNSEHWASDTCIG